MILSTTFMVYLNAHSDYDYNRANGCVGCHTNTSTMSISVNTSSVVVGPSTTFDISITLSSHQSSKPLAYAFWHGSGDGIGVPVPLGSPNGNIINSWSGSTLHYHATWANPGEPRTEYFRITAPSSIGTAYLYIRGVGKGGLGTTEQTITINVESTDITPPDVLITSPSNNDLVKGASVSLSATVDDNLGDGVETVWAEISNATYNEKVYMTGTEPNYSNTWDSTVVSDGIYALALKANDTASNLNNTESINIEVDNTAPYITIVSVVPNPSNGITTITALNTSADINNDGIRAVISTPIGSKIFVNLLYQNSNKWNNTFFVTQDGVYSIQINATDFANNTRNSSSLTINGDVTVPNIDITNPAYNGDQTGGDTISISGTAHGTGSIISSIYINDTRWGVSKQPQTDPSGLSSGSYIFNNNTKILPGFYWVEVNITDNAGNTNKTLRYFEVISSDIFPPILVISSISPNPTKNYTEITVTSNENLIEPPRLNITTPNATILYRTMKLIGVLTWRANLTVYDTGLYIVNINGTDLKSNTRYISDSFYGDVSPPRISILSVFPILSNGLTVITASNSSSDINSNGIWANITTPSRYLYLKLNYQGGNLWNGTFIVDEDGIYKVKVNATDYIGNTNTTDSLIITGDVSAPMIMLNNVLPNLSSGLSVITASNASRDIDNDGIWANITTPSKIFFVKLDYQGNNLWNGSFTISEDGIYTIRINATDYAGNTNITNSINLTGDVSAPEIIINSPSENTEFSNSAPTFNLTISDLNLDEIWYSLFNVTHWTDNITFTELIGTIQLALWNTLPTGVITIRFYANDTLGHINFKEINIIKSQIQQNTNGNNSDNGGNGGNTFIQDLMTVGGILILTASIFIFMLKKARNNNRFMS